MSIPTQIITDLNSLITDVTAAQPLESASVILITALQIEASALVTSIQTALTVAGGNLDASDPITTFPGGYPQVLLDLATAATDQSTLCDMAGLVGRALFNLTQARAG